MIKSDFYFLLSRIIPVLLLLSFSYQTRAQRDPQWHAESVITPMLLKQSIGYLASDSMKGRKTPSPELDAAAAYIAMQFKSWGLQPLDGSYFQELNYCYTDLDRNIFLSLVRDTNTLNFRIGEDFIPHEITGSRPAEGDIVFAGYGITAPEYNYDDYKEIDARRKIVVVLRQEPGQTLTNMKKFAGKELTKYTWLVEKQKNATAHGAAGLVVLSGPLQFKSLKPITYAWPALAKDSSGAGMLLKECPDRSEPIPVVSTGKAMIEALFGSVDSLLHIQQRIENQMAPLSFDLQGKVIAMNIALTNKPVGSRNVMAILPGSDPELKSEAVIIGAHYDHVGCKKTREPGKDYIYNGADDNASGTSGMLAVAKAFATMVETPKRSVIFMAFAGEERGLLGSETYVNMPRWPLKNTVAMLNLDMISRNHPDSLEIVGSKLNPGIMKVIKSQNKKVGLKLMKNKSKEVDYGSDHASFFSKGVPAVFFFTGLHKDYHQVTDEPSKTNPGKASKVSRLVFLSAWQMANESSHYKFIRPAE